MDRTKYQKLRKLLREQVQCPQCGEMSYRAEMKDAKGRRGYSHLDCPYCGATFSWATGGKSHLYAKTQIDQWEKEFGSLINSLEDERSGLFGTFTKGHYDNL